MGKTIDHLLTTHPLQTVIKLSFVANGSESFHIHCFACWTSSEVILFSGSFHLLQDPGYWVWSLASHTKCSVSAGTWYWRLYFLPVLGKHLQVKTGICQSSRGSDMCNFKSHSWQDFLAYCTRPANVHLAMVCVSCSFNSFSIFWLSLKQQQNLMKIMFSCIHFPIWPYSPKIMIFYYFILVNCMGWQVCIHVAMHPRTVHTALGSDVWGETFWSETSF